jgi:hypothetical protein
MRTAGKRIAVAAAALGVLGAACLIGVRKPSRGVDQGSSEPPPKPQTAGDAQAATAGPSEAEREAIRANELAVFRGLSPAERLQEMARRCSPGAPCDRQALGAITQAAADEAERTVLAKKAEGLVAAFDGRPPVETPPSAPPRQPEPVHPLVGAAQAAASGASGEPLDPRDAFAGRLEETLVSRRLNPDRVSVTGPDRTTLEVEGFACSARFLSNVAQSEYGAEARKLGFTRLSCVHGPINASLDL